MISLRSVLLAGLVLAAPAVSHAAQPAPAAHKAELERATARDADRLTALYKTLHANPELAFAEHKTAALLAREMRALGLTVTEGVGGTGVVAILENGPGPRILVRTDMDGLPMAERSGLPWASKATAQHNGKLTPVAHSCGHDIHMTAWVGAARALVAMKDTWRGTLVMVAQPAEETVSGARAMVADRFVERFGKPDAALALHVTPEPVGTVLTRPGLMSSSSDSIDLVFHGKGSHGSAPAASIDPVLMAARFTVDVQSVISREKDPEAFGVVTIGAIQAGEAGNVIPETATLRGTIRTQDEKVRARIIEGVTRTARGVAQIAGAPEPSLAIKPGGRMVVNDPALTGRIAETFKAAFGDGAQTLPLVMSGSEDFSEFAIGGAPVSYFLIGGMAPDAYAKAMREHTLAINHAPEFAPVPQPTISVGAQAMALAVMTLAAPPQP